MVIGITGGIGSGKSTVAAELRRLGYRVYDCDTEAKRLIVEDEHVRQAMTKLFGSDIYEVKGEEETGEEAKKIIYRTDIVAARVFADRTLLTRLNAIVHPAVRHDIECLIANPSNLRQRSGLTSSSASGLTSNSASGLTSNSASGLTSNSEAILFIESAILYESGIAELCDRVVLVTAPEEVRIERCIHRDHQGVASEENINKVRSRIRAQRPDNDIPADLRLINDGMRSINFLAQELIRQCI